MVVFMCTADNCSPARQVGAAVPASSDGRPRLGRNVFVRRLLVPHTPRDSQPPVVITGQRCASSLSCLELEMPYSARGVVAQDCEKHIYKSGWGSFKNFES